MPRTQKGFLNENAIDDGPDGRVPGPAGASGGEPDALQGRSCQGELRRGREHGEPDETGEDGPGPGDDAQGNQGDPRRTSRPDGPGGARHVDQLYPATPQRARRGEQVAGQKFLAENKNKEGVKTLEVTL